MPLWATKQFGHVLDDLKGECTPAAWDDLLIAYAALRQYGPMAGPTVAKKLKSGDGIWELIAHADNIQPRALFYFARGTIIFVHAWIKKGNNEYKDAIRLAQKRRALIERGEKATNEYSPKPTVH